MEKALEHPSQMTTRVNRVLGESFLTLNYSFGHPSIKMESVSVHAQPRSAALTTKSHDTGFTRVVPSIPQARLYKCVEDGELGRLYWVIEVELVTTNHLRP